ncbi:signal recognition particle-docking protein FtsY [Candidatus Woesearchaeota archaeon]|nr:signal recognition particle-docking protein FtsY [Candidatus Woesearchaeota archaeon]
MFKFLKEKLKGAISKLTRKVEEEAKVEESIKGGIEQKEEAKKEEIQGISAKKSQEGIKEEKEIQSPEERDLIEELEAEIQETKEEARTTSGAQTQFGISQGDTPSVEKQEIKAEEKFSEVKTEEEPKEQKPEVVEKKGFFSKLKEKITTTKLPYEKFESLFSDLELALMENNVAFEVIEKIKYELGKNLVEKPIKWGKVEETIGNSLKNSIGELFKVEKIDLLEKIKSKDEKPFVIAFFGINGSGKTTTIAKIADLLKNNDLSCVLAASDTFRAASIEQLQIHADKLGIKLIKQGYGSDPAAVSFDAIKHAQAKNIDVVLIDTAGRLHNQANLMQELKKIVNVTKPDLKLFVGEAIAGNDCTEQAQKFNEVIGIDAIVLTKADVDEKGGAAVSVSYVTKKPIMYLGIGQEYSDLKEFEPSLIVEGLGL